MNYTQTKEKIIFFILLVVFFLLSFNFSFAWDSRITFTEYTDSIIMVSNSTPSASIMWKDNESTGTYFYSETSEIGMPKPTVSGNYHFVGGPSWFISQYQADNFSYNDFMINYPNAGDYTNYFLYEVSTTPEIEGCMVEGVYSYNPLATVSSDYYHQCWDVTYVIKDQYGNIEFGYNKEFNPYFFSLSITNDNKVIGKSIYYIYTNIIQTEDTFKITRPYVNDSYYVPVFSSIRVKKDNISNGYELIDVTNMGLSNGYYYIKTYDPNLSIVEGVPIFSLYGNNTGGYFTINNNSVVFDTVGLYDNENISSIPNCGFSCIRITTPINDSISETTNINIGGDFFVSGDGWTSFGDFNGILIKLVNISTSSDEIETKEIFIENYLLDEDGTFETSVILPENTTWKAQAFIKRGITLMGNPSDTILINVISKPLLIDDTEVCESFNILCHLRNFTKWAFYGGTDNFYEIEKLKQSIEKKPPFGYVSNIFVIIENIRTDRTAVFELQSNTNITDNIFTPLKNGLSWVLWLLFAFYLFKRFKHIEL